MTQRLTFHRLGVLPIALLTLAAVDGGQATAQTPTILYSFDGAHGKNPYGSLILDGATLYGMTYSGGANNQGVIFALTIPEPSAVALLGVSIAAIAFLAFRRRRQVYNDT
jgi:uncharacterized repeat protein (TIGR03803 family)